MFVFYVGVIFRYLVLIKGDYTFGKQMSPQLLEMSLNHMNMLLTDISNKIDFERKLLSLRDESKKITDFSKKDDTSDDTWKRTLERYKAVEANKATPETYQNIQHLKVGPLLQSNMPLPINKLFGEMQFANWPESVYQQTKTQYLPEIRSKLNLDVADARKFFTPSTTTTKASKGHMLKKNLIALVNKENSKYCSHDPLGQPVTANDTDLCRKTITKMAKEGMLNYLEDIILEGLKNLATATWTGQYDPAVFNNDPRLSENSDVSLRAETKGMNTKSAYKKMMQHFILKHPTLFRQYAKHHKHSHKSKHRKSHHKRHHYMHKQQTEIQRKPTYPYIRAKEIKKLPRKVIQTIANMNNKINPNILTRRSNNEDKRLIDKIADISKIVYKAKQNSNYGNRTFTSVTKEETKQQDSVNKTSTTQTTHSNKLVQMIRAESDYSDEELYLKTMLKDALYHSNFTTTATPK